jgi:putative transposase
MATRTGCGAASVECMPRKPRVQQADGLYHVTVRGTEGRAIFLDERDRRYFFRLLGEVVDDLSWQVFAFCLMTNHLHLAFRTPNADLALGMHHVNGLYANRFNRRHAHVGHLQQSRYGSVLIGSEEQLLVACRYVVLNPVRAAMCRRPGDYPWSSYRATAHLERGARWLDIDTVLSWFDGPTTTARVAQYADFVASAIDGGRGRGLAPGGRGLAPGHARTRHAAVRVPARA